MTKVVANKNVVPTKLLWIDLEMTGLDEKNDVILEVAAEVTDFNFKSLASYEAVIHHDNGVLSNMDEWCSHQHAKSGLTERVRNSKQSEESVVQDLVNLISSEFGSEPAILAGNSIHTDRLFIRRWWPEIDNLLHYRMLDVSSYKILMQGKYSIVFEKQEVHRAYEDIHASIAELKYYISWMKKQ